MTHSLETLLRRNSEALARVRDNSTFAGLHANNAAVNLRGMEFLQRAAPIANADAELKRRRSIGHLAIYAKDNAANAIASAGSAATLAGTCFNFAEKISFHPGEETSADLAYANAESALSVAALAMEHAARALAAYRECRRRAADARAGEALESA